MLRIRTPDTWIKDDSDKTAHIFVDEYCKIVSENQTFLNDLLTFRSSDSSDSFFWVTADFKQGLEHELNLVNFGERGLSQIKEASVGVLIYVHR